MVGKFFGDRPARSQPRPKQWLFLESVIDITTTAANAQACKARWTSTASAAMSARLRRLRVHNHDHCADQTSVIPGRAWREPGTQGRQSAVLELLGSGSRLRRVRND